MPGKVCGPGADAVPGGDPLEGTGSEWTFGPGDLAMTVESEGPTWYADRDGFVSVTNDGVSGDEIRYSTCGPGGGGTPGCGPYLGLGLADLSAPFDLLHSESIPDSADDLDFASVVAQGRFVEVDGAIAGVPYQFTVFLTDFRWEGPTSIAEISWGKVRGAYRSR